MYKCYAIVYLLSKKSLNKIKKNTKHIKFNNPLKSIVAKRLNEQHLIQK